ncbi:MAG: hypothetical protein GEU81_14190 [Nitriliruptorales bacterium]|nr:hypothetical protein [Nitriliruptorales bacterium]
MRVLTFVPLAVCCCALVACADGPVSGASEPPDDAPYMIGTITSVAPFEAVTEDCVDPDEAGGPNTTVSSDDPPFCTRPDNNRLGSVVIEEEPDQVTGDQKMVASVSAGTAILRETPEGYEPAAFADLREGAVVAVWTTGPIAESYPVQGAGDAISIITDGAGAS